MKAIIYLISGGNVCVNGFYELEEDKEQIFFRYKDHTYITYKHEEYWNLKVRAK